ncbi:hypothetical protein [Natronorubrum sulfidifaciens]|uniref:Uncharacterized protein n=1 Tax=Natronorubrum sulfidifaciens JCM 14089 TaxID=1230460 RepID=L9WFS9_9EURY|nr:hypothetical protein [Natronorubrum sulfidifaciens]ELY48314.1 hypothetical protein C495_02540 [Natronorubrum sulfidifaciens JCM 14089]
MTELTIPPDTDKNRAAELVRQHVTTGDTVEIWDRERTDGDDPNHTGTVTDITPGYLELDGHSPTDSSVRYDEIDTVIRVESS